MKQPTEQEEHAFIDKHWNREQILNDIGHVRGRRQKMKRLEYECAYRASKTSSIQEAGVHAVAAMTKLAVCAIPGAILYKVGSEVYDMASRGNVRAAAGITVFGSMFLVPSVIALKYGLFGKHPVSGYGNYYKAPWFGAVDNARFSINWLRIYAAQCMGKIRKGTGKLAEDNGLHHYHGGP